MACTEVGRLIQEDLCDPWQVLVACVFLNRSRGSVVRSVFTEVIRRWPTAQALSRVRANVLARALRPTGLQNVKAKRAIALSKAWTRLPRSRRSREMVSALPGVGEYALDSWAIFVDGDLTIEPRDAHLRRYVGARRGR